MSRRASAEPPKGWEWAVCGASVIGSEHQRRGLGCDDAYSYGAIGDFVVAAVADGAGSVTGTSALGSYAACQSVLADATTPRFIGDYRAAPVPVREDMMRWLFDWALERVQRQARVLDLDVALLATTLSVAVADRTTATFGQIGDGIIATESETGIGTLLVESKDEYANATWFIQSHGAFDTAYRCVTQYGSTALALSTDGMSYKITNVATGEAYQPFFRGSWEHVRTGVSSDNLAALLRSIEDDQTGDDKTMVLAALRQRDNLTSSSAGEAPLLFTDSSRPPPLPAANDAAPHNDPPPRLKEVASPGWVTVLPDNAESGATVAPEPATDQLPADRRSTSRPKIIRLHPR